MSPDQIYLVCLVAFCAVVLLPFLILHHRIMSGRRYPTVPLAPQMPAWCAAIEADQLAAFAKYGRKREPTVDRLAELHRRQAAARGNNIQPCPAAPDNAPHYLCDEACRHACEAAARV